MALCTDVCCNAEARARVEAEKARILAENTAAFEAWEAERLAPGSAPTATATLVVTLAPTAEENDISYDEAKARAGIE